MKGLHSVLFHREMKPLGSARVQQRAGCTADVSDCVTVRREVVPLTVSSGLFCPSGNYKPGQVCFPLFLFTDKVSGAGGCIQFPGRRRRADAWLHCQDARETQSRRTTDTEVPFYCNPGLLNLQARLEWV